jgi:predicted HicB family RNase H-like nuclease
MAIAQILTAFLAYDNMKGRGDYMEKERKAITIRVSPELKFQIDKAADADWRTINSWIIKVIRDKLNESEKK